MSALPQPDFLTQYYSPKPQFLDNSDRNRAVINPAPPQVKRVVKNRNFPQQNRLPYNLKLLLVLQKSSFGLALALMLSSIGLYISTVQIPRLWSEEYRNLENLQRQERELIAINETLKYQLAHQASQDNNLSISKPESAVFIPPVKVSPKTKLEATPVSKEVQFKHRNLGY